MVETSAPAKIILVGEHAVVYGQPAIAVPVSGLRAFATVQPNDPAGQGLRIVAADQGVIVTSETYPDHPLAITAQLVLQTYRTAPPDVTVTVHSSIPVASGMGSGAAVATALARVLGATLNLPLDNEALNPIIYEVEKIHHGTPSGIDNTVVVYEKPVYFIRDQPIVRLTIGKPFLLLIADSGLAASTRVAVGDVRKLYAAESKCIQSIFNAIGERVVASKQAIESGDVIQLGKMMHENHHLLQQLTVSCAELDNLATAAMNAGALGAKLSGGGRGGAMIALVTPETVENVKQALLRAGAVSVFATTVQ
jgi:mevalonate kinase